MNWALRQARYTMVFLNEFAHALAAEAVVGTAKRET
jgi:hypothetical protein